MRDGPDRPNVTQLPLFLLVVFLPLLSRTIAKAYPKLISYLFGLQIVGYLAYESGVSNNTNIRVDLPLILGAIVWHFRIVARARKSAAERRASESTR